MIRNCTFYGNAAGANGGGISIEQCGLSLESTIIAWGAEGEEDVAIGAGGPALRVDPNPFRAMTRIGFTTAGASPVRIAAVDPAGRLVRTLRSDPAAVGMLELFWDGRNDAGVPIAAGVYLVRADSRGGSIARSVIVLR